MGRDTQLGLNRHTGFTLVEIIIVIGVITLLAAIAVPGFLRARRRAQASQVKGDLRLIEAAVDQYAIDTNKPSGALVEVPDWTAYVKPGTRLYTTGEDVIGNDFGPQTVDEMPMVPFETYIELGDIADDAFWEPFDL